MTAQLTPTLENFVRDCLKGGRYNNRSEVMRAGLRLLMDQEQAPKMAPAKDSGLNGDAVKLEQPKHEGNAVRQRKVRKKVKR